MTVTTDHLSDAPSMAGLMSEAMLFYSRMTKVLGNDPERVSRMSSHLARGKPTQFFISAAKAVDKSVKVIWIDADCVDFFFSAEIKKAFSARVGRMPTSEERLQVAAAILRSSELEAEWAEVEGRFLQRLKEASTETLFPYIDKVSIPRK